MSNVTFLDSTAMAMMLRVNKHAQVHEKQVTSWNLHPIAAHALKVVAFDERRSVTRRASVAACRSQHSANIARGAGVSPIRGQSIDQRAPAVVEAWSTWRT
jgi:hypothetical protein